MYRSRKSAKLSNRLLIYINHKIIYLTYLPSNLVEIISLYNVYIYIFSWPKNLLAVDWQQYTPADLATIKFVLYILILVISLLDYFFKQLKHREGYIYIYSVPCASHFSSSSMFFLEKHHFLGILFFPTTYTFMLYSATGRRRCCCCRRRCRCAS